MRNDLCVYWVEDTQTWCDSAKELLKYDINDLGLSVDFLCERNADTAKREIENSCRGFKKYDLFFIDYNISSDIDGKDIISSLRGNKIDVDILFYSANKEKDIRDTVSQNLSSYEGVYIANRDSFREKAASLIEKSARKLLSIQNIRGKLMDCTSENDFIINSYIIKKYKNLTPEQKDAINLFIVDYLKRCVLPNSKNITSKVTRIEENGIEKIKDFMGYPSYIVPLELKYHLFSKIAGALGESDANIESYFDSIVKKRNTLAHKKLDICDNGNRIKYCDTLDQFKARRCDQQCENCYDTNSISFEDWNGIRKQANAFSLWFDTILSKL